MANDKATARDHLSAEEVAGYLDRALSAAQQVTVEAHLADCAECRGELTEVARVRRTRPRWTRWYVTTPTAAAAVILLLVWRTGAPGSSDVLRDTGVGAEGIPRFAVVAPLESSHVAPDSAVFIWRSAGEDAHYRLTLTDMTGDVLWTGTPADTTAILPSDIDLVVGQTYFWFVDALLPNGESATTGVQQFRTTR